MWGQDKYFMQWASETRIIPTRVGTREGEQVTVTSDKDHPHACGDKPMTEYEEENVQGSSPRVWGQERGII